MTEITVNGTSYLVSNGNSISAQPHIEDAITHEIPMGKQLEILKSFLIEYGVSPIPTATTHWCVREVLKIGVESKAHSSEVEVPILPITSHNIEKLNRMVLETDNYGKEAELLHSCLCKFPDNTDLDIIAMKIGLIDVTNSTSLSRYKKNISLYELASFIKSIPNFDQRISEGDKSLIPLISKNNGNIILFSFASKYCTYHNVEVYGRDDYSIYDTRIKEILPKYCPSLREKDIETWRKNSDYDSFAQCIDSLLNANNISIPHKRRKFDHFLWYQGKDNNV